MAEANGNWVSNGYNLYRVLLRTSGTTIIVYGEIASGASYLGSVNLVRSGSWSGSGYVAFSGTAGTRELYRQDVGAVSGTFTASITGDNGTSTASVSVDFRAPSVPLPGKPTNFKVVRTSDTAANLSFTKGSNAASTQITASKDGTAWYELANPTAASQPVSGLVVNSWWRFNAYSKNAAGASGVVGPYEVFTKPKPPTTPVLASGKKASWTLPSKYKHGVQIQRTDNAGSTATTYDLGAVTEWIDPAAQSPLSQYRVRVWAGPSIDEPKTYSDWSAWSTTVMGLTYKAPAVTKLDAYRCDSAGVRSETGKYLRVVSSGTVSKVPNASNTETNKVTRKVAYRKVGTTTWTETSVVTNGTPANWTNAGITIGGGNILETSAWEVRYTVQDVYSTVVSQALLVPVAKVPFSIGPSGTGHGKTWERGALDVGGDAYIEGTLIADKLAVTDPNLITVDGVDYQASGVIEVSDTTPFTAYAPIYSRLLSVPAPYQPPPGWDFQVTTYTSGTRLCLFNLNAATVGGVMTIRHLQVANSSVGAGAAFSWRLCRV